MANEGAGSDRAELKKLLRLASEQPVSMAFALGADGKAAIKLHKAKPPRSLEKSLKDGIDGAKNFRFGTVVLDPEDPKRVKFMVNKAAGGIARKLVIALKGTGFSKVQIVTEDGETEDHEEQDEEQDQDEPPTLKGNEDQEAEPAEAAQAAAPDEPADAGAMAQELTGLVRRMLGVIKDDPSRKTALAELATDAQASLKRGDLQQAAAGIDIFRMALDDAGNGPAVDYGQGDDDDAAMEAGTGNERGEEDQTDPEAEENEPEADTGSDDDVTDADVNTDEDRSSNLNPAVLAKTLSDLVKQLMPVIADDPTHRDTVRGLASNAQASLKQGDLERAHQHVTGLQGLLNGMFDRPNGAAAPADGTSAPNGRPPPRPGSRPMNMAGFVKARQAWLAARSKVEGDVDKLRKEMKNIYKDHGVLGEIDKFFNSKVEPILQKLDHTLAERLDDVASNADPQQHAQYVDSAKRVLEEYKSYVEAEKFIAELDENPFVPLQIRKTLTSTLNVLERVIA